MNGDIMSEFERQAAEQQAVRDVGESTEIIVPAMRDGMYVAPGGEKTNYPSGPATITQKTKLTLG